MIIGMAFEVIVLSRRRKLPSQQNAPRDSGPPEARVADIPSEAGTAFEPGIVIRAGSGWQSDEDGVWNAASMRCIRRTGTQQPGGLSAFDIYLSTSNSRIVGFDIIGEVARPLKAYLLRSEIRPNYWYVSAYVIVVML